MKDSLAEKSVIRNNGDRPVPHAMQYFMPKKSKESGHDKIQSFENIERIVKAARGARDYKIRLTGERLWQGKDCQSVTLARSRRRGAGHDNKRDYAADLAMT